MELILALVLGTLFGFVLQRIGAADPDKIIGMLTLRDLHLMKAILTGIGVSSALLFGGLLLGSVDPSHLSVKSLYWGVIVGGLLLGFGWGLSGYCPGTALAAAGNGRKDAWFFIAGGLLGAGFFSGVYAKLENTILFEDLLGGALTLVETPATQSLISGTWSPLAAILIGLGLIAIAKFLPLKM